MWVCVCRKVTFHLVTTRARLFFRNTRTFFSFGVCVRYIFSPFRPYLLAFQQCHRQRPCASSTHTYRAHRKIYVLGFIYFLSQRFFKANEEASEQHTHTILKTSYTFIACFFRLESFKANVNCDVWIARTHVFVGKFLREWKRQVTHASTPTHHTSFARTRTHDSLTTGAPTVAKKWVLI